MEARCLNPKCHRTAETRGLCSTCYTIARNAVRRGETTWAKLEAEGKVSPRKNLPSTAREWLFGSPKKKKVKE